MIGLIFLISISSFTFLPICKARDVTGEIQLNKDSCFDVGFVDYLPSAGACQRACTFEPDCNSWGYTHGGKYRCHLCTWTTPRRDVDCDPADSPCKTWGLRESGNINVVTILNDNISAAAGVCTGELQGEEALAAASDLNMIVDKFGSGDFDSDQAFMSNLESAANEAAAVLRSETQSCRNNFTNLSNNCKYGSLVFHQLRALLLHVDELPNRAFPGATKQNKFRRKLFNVHKIFLADNFWMTKKSTKKIFKFYSQLPAHMKSEGILYDALFATQTVRNAWKCNGVSPGYLGTSNRGFNVFKLQVGEDFEQGFPDDTPERPPAADLQLIVTRHEVAHQFDRIVANRANAGDPRLRDMKDMLKEASVGSDYSWLRSNVGDDYFQSNPQEIIASQIGNQYLCSTSAQLRLGAERLSTLSNGVAMSWFLFNADLLTSASSVVPFYENEQDGTVSKIAATVTRDQSNNRITSIDIPFCGVVSFTYDNNGIVNSVSENAISCNFVCEDDMDWRFVKANGKEVTCNWVGLNLQKRCGKRGVDSRRARDACPLTCNEC